MNVLITGVSGFIGSSLASALSMRGHSVTGTCRRPDQSPPGCQTTHVWAQGTPCEPEVFSGIDLLVHSVYDSQASEQASVEAMAMLQAAAREAGVKRQVLLSSLSARPDSVTAYGRQKFRMETFFRQPEDIIVRPGLVVGDGGVFRTLERNLERSLIFPLIDGGRSQVSFVGLDDLIVCLCRLIESPPLGGGPYNLFQPRSVEFAEMVRELARAKDLKRYFVGVPGALLLLILGVTEILRLPLSIRRDNILGLRQNSSHPYESSLNLFEIAPRDFSRCYSDNRLRGFKCVELSSPAHRRTAPRTRSISASVMS